jgi:hypothetical protein
MDDDDWLLIQEETSGKGGIRMAPTTPEPPFDPNERWAELAPLKKIAPAAVWDLVEELRQAGVPVRGKPRSAGLFSGGKVNVTLRVPERLRAEAARIVENFFAGR